MMLNAIQLHACLVLTVMYAHPSIFNSQYSVHFIITPHIITQHTRIQIITIYDNIPTHTQVKCSAMVRLYVTPPNGIVWKFTNIIGVLAVMNDNNMKGHFLRIVDVKVAPPFSFRPIPLKSSIDINMVV